MVLTTEIGNAPHHGGSIRDKAAKRVAPDYTDPLDAVCDAYTPVSGPVLSEMLSTFTPTFSSSVSPRFMNGVCMS